MSQVPAIHVDGVWKSFQVPREQVHTLKERALHPFRRNQMIEFGALKDVSFTVAPGEFFGIVGRNGSGKSTLLKCMAGIYATDHGRIYVDGRLSTFIELGVGFNPDLPARDNVALNATMLGLSPREANRRLDEVIDFAELHEFVDLKLKNYSSGMMVRLAFAVMIQVDAEVLLIDEVLAVGDAAFQQKCYDEFGRLRREGRTVVLVTHDMAAARRFCDRAMLLERGDMVAIGSSDGVANRYLELNFGDTRRVERGEGRDVVRTGDGKARIADAWFEDADGKRVDVVPNGDTCRHHMRVVFAEDVHDPVFSITVTHPDGITMLTADRGILKPTGSFAAGEEVIVRTTFLNALAPDTYTVTPAVAYPGNLHYLDRAEHLQLFTTTGTRLGAGILELPVAVEVERRAERAPA